ncbi:NUDIX hydrolase [Macrococcus epidermidis]|uniref:NUDIX hydrolase n=1 Tax=Macrococcus epidermidis TaxID=1902580 RepID=UPI0020B7CF30|nr:NUDIX domain-containing protein [Macrococcus epidermidis]UTH15044.1 NUDIX domain-containing protein [Macrococcus epidermidis]
MIKYICSNLVDIKGDKILLVKVRDNEKYYLPGGKIETGEDDKESLVREIQEELSLELDPARLTYYDTIIGPAYPDIENQVELRCYMYDGIKEYQKSNEITAVEYIEMNESELIAPAVNILIEKLREKGE